jgi:hypothetical protein
MRSMHSSNALIGGGDARQIVANARFINLLEQVLLAIKQDVPPERFNFLLKSLAQLAYRLALEAGDFDAAKDIAHITNGPPNQRRRHGGGTHQHR